jgi:hypothetical protein
MLPYLERGRHRKAHYRSDGPCCYNALVLLVGGIRQMGVSDDCVKDYLAGI